MSSAFEAENFERADQYVQMVEAGFGQFLAGAFDLIKGMLDFFDQPLFFAGCDFIAGNGGD